MLRRVRATASWALFVALVVLLWPVGLGGCTSFTVVSGHSMEPTYLTGDVVMARCGEPRVGDVVIYKPAELAGQRIIHRVIGGGPDGWHLRGDNNDFVDPFTPTSDEVVGIAQAHLPRIGVVVAWADDPLVWLSVLVLALALLAWPSGRDDEHGDEPADDEARDDDEAREDDDRQASAPRHVAAVPGAAPGPAQGTP